MNYLVLLIFLISSAAIAATDPEHVKVKQLYETQHVRDFSSYTFPTKFGELKFVRDNGELGVPAGTITLDGKPLVAAKNQVDAQGVSLSLMTEIMTSTSVETARRRPGEKGRTDTKRMLVLIGGNGNCVKKLIILDFTGTKPYVSDTFGNDPNDRFCLTFKKAKWGKKESEIVLDGPTNYIYYTNDKIVDPFVYE